MKNVIVQIILLFILTACSKKNSSGTTTGQPEPPRPFYDKTVAADGTGDYKTVQEAVNNAPANRTKPYVIYIKKGVYKELLTIAKNKTYIHFVGENAESTIITYDNYASKINPATGAQYGTSGSASVFVNGSYFIAEQITFENSSGPVGQALAINAGADKAAFKNCRFLGYQDTYYGANNNTAYFLNCYIAGTVDYIFGGFTAYFQKCQLHNLADGYITAASTPAEKNYGYVFDSCTLTAANTSVKTYLGRPWRPYAKVVFMNTVMGGHIRPEGWHNWGDAANEATAFYAEYNNSGAGNQPGKRVTWSRQLTINDAANYTKEKVLDNWSPVFIK